MTEKQDHARRAEMARQLNRSIYEAGLSLSGGEDEEFDLTFFCECGCMAEVKLPLSDYEAAGGAYAEGHSPPEDAT